MTEHLTDTRYWDRIWENRDIPAPLDPRDSSLRNFVERRWHGYFKHIFDAIGFNEGNSSRKLIEVGCGGSKVLPYFRLQFGFEIAGLDNSSVGCASSQRINDTAKVSADVRQADLFDPPQDWIESFDIVYSHGLVEHFRPTTVAVEALARLARRGGYLITIVPNLSGLLGVLQKQVNRPVYDIHVPLALEELRHAHRECGLDIIDCRYVLTANFSVLNFGGGASKVPERLGLRMASWTTKAIWTLQNIGLPEIPNRMTSPYIVCVARKNPSSDGDGIRLSRTR